MKNLLKLHEKLGIFPLKYSPDFNGFWFHSARGVEIFLAASCYRNRG